MFIVTFDLICRIIFQYCS